MFQMNTRILGILLFFTRSILLHTKMQELGTVLRMFALSAFLHAWETFFIPDQHSTGCARYSSPSLILISSVFRSITTNHIIITQHLYHLFTPSPSPPTHIRRVLLVHCPATSITSVLSSLYFTFNLVQLWSSSFSDPDPDPVCFLGFRLSSFFVRFPSRARPCACCPPPVGEVHRWHFRFLLLLQWRSLPS